MEKLEERNVEKVLARAKKAIVMLKPKEDYNGIAQGPFTYKTANQADKSILNITNEGIADIAYAAINGAIEGKATNSNGMIVVDHTDNELATSKGAHATGSSTEARISFRVFRGDAFSFQDVAGSTKLRGIEPERIARDAAETLAKTRGTGRIEKGKYDIVYKQSPGGALIYMTNSMACIGNVETGGFFTGRLGKQVASKEINIYDDGNIQNGIESSPYDSEGYPTGRTLVVRSGMLANYLHNYSTAKKYHKKSTGNAGLVEPSPNTMFFEHRSRVKSIDELVAKVDNGVLITNTWYTRFSNYLTGDFSTVPRDLALYIKKGEIQFAIKQRDVSSMVGIRINDNMIRMMENTECAADDTSQASSWDVDGAYYFMPSILVRGADISVA